MLQAWLDSTSVQMKAYCKSNLWVFKVKKLDILQAK